MTKSLPIPDDLEPLAPAPSPAVDPKLLAPTDDDLEPADDDHIVLLNNEPIQMKQSALQRYSNIVSGAYKKGNAAAEINSLYFQKFLGDQDPGLDSRITQLRPLTESQIMTQGLVQDAVRATVEQTPQLVEMAKKALVRGGEGAAVGAGVGAAIGSVVPGAGTAAGATGGAIRGSIWGARLGVIENSFIQNTGSSYEEFSNLKGKDGKPIGDADAARIAALVSGASQAGLDVLPLKAFSKLLPFRSELMAKLEKSGAKAIFVPKGKANIGGFVRDLVAAQATEVGVEGAQEGIQAWVGEGLKKYLSEQDIAPAANGEILKRVGGAMKEAALSIIPITAGGAIVSKSVESGVRMAAKKSTTSQSEVTAKAGFEEQANPTVQATVNENALVNEVPKVEAKVAADSTLDASQQKLASALSDIQQNRSDGATFDATTDLTGNTNALILRGRLKKLDSDLSFIDDKIDSISQQIDTRSQAKQPTEKLQNQLNNLVEKRDGMDEERSNLLFEDKRLTKLLEPTNVTAQDLVQKDAENRNISVRGGEVKKISQQAIREINTSFRQGRVLAKKDVTESQNFITEVIDQSALKAEDKAKFIRTIKNIQDGETLVKRLPEIQSRVSNLVEKATKRVLKAEIKDSLSETKTKKQSGKPVGKFTAENQTTLDRLRKASKFKASDASDILNANISKNSELAKRGVLPSYEDSLENSVLSIVADRDKMSVSEIEKLRDEINQIKTEGKSTREKTLLAKRAKVEEIRAGLNELITQGENLQLKDKTFGKASLNRINNWNAWINYDWNEILDSILAPLKTDPAVKASVIDQLSITRLVQQEKGIVRRRRDRFIDSAKEALGIATEGALNDKFYADSKSQNLGIFIDKNGQPKKLNYSVAEARKFWMEMQDPSLEETIIGEEGMAYTPEMVSAITSILSPNDIAFARSQLELYKEFYPEINKVYARVYGVNLPAIENYSPISRVVDKDVDSTVGEFLQETFVRLSIAPGSLKSRENSLGELKQRSDIEVYQKHIAEMSHFIAMQEKIQQIQQIFSDKDLRKNIDAQFGKEMMELIDDNIESFVKNGAEKSNALGKIINTLNRGFARSVLGGKLALTAKQATSTLAYWENMPAKDFAAGVADFMKNPRNAIDTLNKSELVKARGVPEVDLAKLGQTTESHQKFAGAFRKYNKFTDFMLLPVKFGDKGAILIGGWAFYKYQLKQGKTPEQAMQAFEDFTARTQQSVDVDRISGLQRSNAFARTMTMFLSAPNAYYRAEIRAIRQFKRGEISGKDFGKKIFLYHFALPALFQFVANGFSYDEEDQLIAMATGALNGYLIVGDLLTNAIRSFMGEDFYKTDLKFLKAGEEIFSGIADAAKNFGDFDDMLEAMADIAKGAGQVTGLPVDQAKNLAEGVDDFERGRPVRGSLRFAGWPKKAVEEIDE